MSVHIKAGGKFVIIAAIVGAIGFGAYKSGYLNDRPHKSASIPAAIDIPGQSPAEVAAASQSTPTSTASAPTQVSMAPASSGATIKVLEMAWNAQMGLNYSNGGPNTTSGSLMAKHGLKVNIARQDDYSEMAAAQVAFAKNPNDGAAFVIIMGDGYPAYVAGLQDTLNKMGQQVQVIGSVGYSRGEDKCMLPPEVKANPQLARGKTVAAVLRDGDWNICVKWAADNGIPINPDEKTYDPDAMNFIATDDYVKSGEKYISGYSETRPIFQNGKLTGHTQKVTTDGVATWTPVDVTIAHQKGGIIPIASTKEYLWQMPAVIIGNKAWMEANRDVVDNFLAAAFEGGEAVRSNDAALTAGADASAKIYNEENGAYWKKYFKGVTETDKQGLSVALGGSTTSGLGDNAYLFGENGQHDLYDSVYTVYGKIASGYYPDVLPTVLPYTTVVNKSFVEDLLKKAPVVAKADKPVYVENAPTTGTFAKKSYHIDRPREAERSDGLDPRHPR
jgi:OOP family OmpA-OmpF porin